MGRGVSRRSRGLGLWGWGWRLCMLAAIWLVGVAGWIVWIGDRDQAAPADVIIVLGAAAYDARPSPVFEERIRHALDLYAQGYAPRLLFTGGFGNGARFAESQVARRYALRHGIPPEAIADRNRITHHPAEPAAGARADGASRHAPGHHRQRPAAHGARCG